MKIISLDTSAKTATVALLDDGRLISEFTAATDTHSSVILPMIENILKVAGLTFDHIGMYACSVGPGSFTGIRIGVATLKGLAFKNNTPCVGVSALEAMAECFCGIDGIIVPVIDARRDMVYTATFRSENGNLTRLTDDGQIAIDELVASLAGTAEPIWFIGDAYEKMMAHPNKPETAQNTPAKLRVQSAYGVGSAAYKKWLMTEDKAQFTDQNLNPVYLKKSQAEREREERIKNQSIGE